RLSQDTLDRAHDDARAIVGRDDHAYPRATRMEAPVLTRPEQPLRDAGADSVCARTHLSASLHARGGRPRLAVARTASAATPRLTCPAGPERRAAAAARTPPLSAPG